VRAGDGRARLEPRPLQRHKQVPHVRGLGGQSVEWIVQVLRASGVSACRAASPVSGTGIRTTWWRTQKRISAARTGGRVPLSRSHACVAPADVPSATVAGVKSSDSRLCLTTLD